MQFQTYEYLFIFLPIVFILYNLVRKNIFFSNTILYTASFLFYGFFGWYFLIFLIMSACVDFFVGRKIHQTSDKKVRRNWLLGSLGFNLSVLCFAKYMGWFLEETESLFSFIGLNSELFNYTIPLVPGISFYTFQTLSYTIDIYKGEEKPHKSFSSYLTFVSFFPQLIAGPIERSKNLLPQFETVKTAVSSKVAASALFLITWGVFKKLVFADNFADIANGVNLSSPGMGIVFSYAFALQIYCDFSAYTDIARGSARLFNIQLSRNFLTPYFSSNPSEFWKRWHITLSSWIRDYIYIPLGGSRDKPSKTIINLTLTMFLCGLWHGAGVNFIIWGLFHAALLIIYNKFPIHIILEKVLGKKFGKLSAIFLFFNLTCIGWIFFRAESLKEATKAFLSIINIITEGVNTDFFYAFYVFLIFAIPLMITELISWRKNTEYGDLYEAMPSWLKAGHYIVFFYGLIWLGKRVSNEFIYFQF